MSGKKFLLILLVILMSPLSRAQDSSVVKTDLLKQFKAQQDPTKKFEIFYGSANRYEESSTIDWLDAVNKFSDITEKVGDTLAIQQFNLIKAQIYLDQGDYARSINLANELYARIDSLDKGLQQALLELMDRNYAELQFFDQQIEIRKEKRERGFTKNIAFYDIYSGLGAHRKAMNDYIMEVKKEIDENDFLALAEYHNNVGNYLRLDRSPATAITHLSKAKGFVEVFLNDLSNPNTEEFMAKGRLLKGIIEGNIGKAYLQMEAYDKAIPSLETSMDIIDSNDRGRYNPELVENTLYLAEAHLAKDNMREAKEYLDSEMLLRRSSHELKKNRLLAEYYDKVSDYQNASRYLQRYVRIQDSLEQQESSLKKQQLLTVVAQEDLENSQRMINEQKLEMERARNEMQAKDERINLVFISLIFTLLGFAGLVYAYLKSIKNQRLIAEQKHIIENALVEKDSLLKEIHHRVKNNLQMVSSLLSLQTKNTKSRAAIEALEEGKSRVKAMALIHQKLYQNDDLSVIEMQGYIESLVNSVQSVFRKGGHNINITIDAEGVELDIDRAIPFGLILNELVSNSFKYAFPETTENGKIYIHLRKNGEQGYFEYTDNGIGLPDDSDERASNSMGIRLMNRLVNQLQSTLNIDNKPDGARFWFHFK